MADNVLKNTDENRQEHMEDEWELSKENVQPLRRGRNLHSLNAGLQMQCTDQSRIRDEKHNFEAELRTYTGDDPLDVWYRYLRWCEQTSPKGDKVFTTILQRCIEKFKEEEKYRNDERYIFAWIRMADVGDDPQEVYNFMYDKGFGCQLCCFYDAWAVLYERVGNLKKANTIYLEGIKRNARPLELLKKKHGEFQMRVARHLAGGEETTDDGSSDLDTQRQVLSQLRPTSKQRAPINRAGEAVKGSAGVFTGARSKTGLAARQQTFQVYSDENQHPDSLQPQTGQYGQIPVRNIINKENEKKAGIWTKQRLGKPSSGGAPYGTVAKKPSFTVHEDEEGDQEMRTPAKAPEIDDQALRKGKQQAPTRSYLTQMEDTGGKPSEKPMYCKDKIYCGAEEFSFEELRAVRWRKKKEQKERDEETKALEECRKRLEHERKMLLDEAERVRLQRLAMMQENEQKVIETYRRLEEQRQRMERENELALQRHKKEIEETIQRRLQEQMTRTQATLQLRSDTSSRQLMFDDGSHGNTENIPPQMLARATQRPQANLQPGVGVNTSTHTPGSQSFNGSGLRHLDTSDRTLSGNPSPTVNTKEAMRLVMGMFNTSLELDKETPMEDEVTEPPPALQAGPPSTSTLPKPFTIYDETKETVDTAPNERKETASARPPSTSTAAMPFTIYYESQEAVSTAPSESMEPVATGPLSTAAMPFTIYDESKETAAPFTIFQDDGGSSGTDIQQSEKPAVQKQPIYTRALFEDELTEHIQSHARDDITLAPIGSHLSFAASAKFASTPFNPNALRGAFRTDLDISDVEMREEKPADIPNRKSPELSSEGNATAADASVTNVSNTSSSNSLRKTLSPIMEGSSEDSGASSTKSGNHTTITSHMKTLQHLSTVSDQMEDTMSLLRGVEAENHMLHGVEAENHMLHGVEKQNQSMTHVIDVSTYTPPEQEGRTENLNVTLCLVERGDPFDVEMKERFLAKMNPPLYSHSNYYGMENDMPEIHKRSALLIGMDSYEIEEKIGEGGFAKVFKAISESFDDSVPEYVAIKVEKPAQKWELYICNELHNRLTQLRNPVDVRPSMMKVLYAMVYENGSCLVTDFQKHGTLLDLLNKVHAGKKDFMSHQSEPILTYMTIELLHMIEQMHRCHIIHGDIKPDNFLMLSFPQLPESTDPHVVFRGSNRFTQLIDFGQSIDMTKYPAGTTFQAKVTTKCFQCIEMMTNQPWTYQTDLFGLAGTIHVMVFKQYMKVYQAGDSWKMTSKFPRNWNQTLWNSLFHTLLNVPSCEEIPDLSVIRRKMEDYFVTNHLQKYNLQCRSFNKTLTSR